MKRKSAQLQKNVHIQKIRLSKDKSHIVKKINKHKEQEDSQPNNTTTHLLESTPGSTRSKQESSLVLSKTKSEPTQSISLHISEDIEDDIPDDQYNEMLKEISRSLNFDMPNKNQKKTATIKEVHQKKYEKYSSFQYDHSLHKEVAIEIVIEANGRVDYKGIANEIKTKLMSIEDFVYYEYSNIQNITMSNYSQVDYVNYEHLYQKSQVMNDKMKKEIKEVNLLMALSSLYQKFIHMDTTSFYFITPMHSFLFSNVNQHKEEDNDEDDNDDEDSHQSLSLLKQKKTLAVLSNTLLLEKQLDSNLIRYAKMTPSKKHKRNRNEDESNSNSHDNDTEMNQFDKEKFNSNPAIVEGYYITLLYNMMISEYENKTFNLIAPFSFEGATYHQNTIKVESYDKKDKGIYMICINISGCIFESKLRDIVKILSKDNNKTKLSKTAYSYQMKLERIASNCEFYALNTNLSHSIERVEYKDNEYYLK